MLDLKGKWVLITGASRGLGRLAAKLMAEQGCNQGAWITLYLSKRKLRHWALIVIPLKLILMISRR